jgi:hypothetical protein
VTGPDPVALILLLSNGQVKEDGCRQVTQLSLSGLYVA